MSAVLTVRQLTEQLGRTLEKGFPYVWVQGEVTNLSRPASGHVYFSLKEDECLLNCVWFRGRQKDERFDPLTGEVWDDGPRSCLASVMETGQTLLCAGSLRAYSARSQYQLIVEHAIPYGMGAWHREFEALKKKLSAEGLFDAAAKRPIPSNPKRVAVVTAPAGAAVRDFLRIAGERGTGSAEIRIFPTPVQGDDAPPLIVDALRRAARGIQDADGSWTPDVIVLIRGGGSMQDLWAFNDERVARAARSSPIPVLTGIGHEIDLSITDMAADLSAATPSHTAQLLWPDRTQFFMQAERLEQALFQAMDHALDEYQRAVSHREHMLRLLSPAVRLEEKRLAHENAVRRMDAAFKARFSQSAQALDRVWTSLAHAGGIVTERRFPALQDMGYRLCRAGDSILDGAGQESGQAEHALAALGRHIGDLQDRQCETLAARLFALDPFAPLKRGYALALTGDGSCLRSLSQVRAGDRISVQVGDGRIHARVETMEPKA